MTLAIMIVGFPFAFWLGFHVGVWGTIRHARRNPSLWAKWLIKWRGEL
jgi:hypothetical protein